MSTFAVGFCIGSSASYVVVAGQGGIETLFNEFDDRNTPTCVSFNGKMRYIGYEAKQQPMKDVRNRLCAFTRFMGKTFDDSINEIKSMQCIGYDLNKPKKNVSFNYIGSTRKVVSETKDSMGKRFAFKVEYCGEERELCVEQVYAMQLSKLKEIAEIKLGKEVVNVVINVPTNATDSHRRAILDAAKIANVNCVRIINDTTATALAYAFYHRNSSESYYKERIVVFVDMGYSHLQSSIVSFRDGQIRVIASSCYDIGGYDFDRAIYDHIKTDFETKNNVKMDDNTKMAVRLMQECEKLKKSMNASNASIPLNIHCFIGDVDLSTTMKQSKFEELSGEILSRVRKTLERLMRDGRVRLEDIDDVEIVGGSTRLSAIKQIITDVFSKIPRSSIHDEEVVGKGCAVQAAILTPNLQFKELRIVDLYLHKIILGGDDSTDTRLTDKIEKLCLPALISTFDYINLSKLEVIRKDRSIIISLFKDTFSSHKEVNTNGKLTISIQKPITTENTFPIETLTLNDIEEFRKQEQKIKKEVRSEKDKVCEQNSSLEKLNKKKRKESESRKKLTEDSVTLNSYDEETIRIKNEEVNGKNNSTEKSFDSEKVGKGKPNNTTSQNQDGSVSHESDDPNSNEDT